MQRPSWRWQWEHNMSSSSSNATLQHKARLFHTSFYWGKDTQILFHGWPGTSSPMYVLALFFVFALALLVESFSHLLKLFKPGSNRFASCIFQTALHAVRSGFSYFVVLALTSFNAGIFIAALFGHALGYSIFSSGLCFSNDTSFSHA